MIQSSDTLIYYTSLINYCPKLIQFLSAQDKSKALSLNNEQRKKTFILGRALLALSLEKITGHSQYSITYSPMGKPLLETPEMWHFNLSHSHKHLILALQKRQIGLDCEHIKSRNFTGIINNFFSNQEQQTIKNSPTPLIQFYTIWTQHEARIKYTGTSSVFSRPAQKKGLSIQSFQYKECVFSICQSQENNKPHPIHAYHWDLANKTTKLISNLKSI